MVTTLHITPDKDQELGLYVKNIMIFQGQATEEQTTLTFYADGYPGLLYYQSKSPLLVQPQGKLLPPLSLYGLTLQPVQLTIGYPFVIMVYQLYPFVLRSFWGFQPEGLHDDCYDLTRESRIDSTKILFEQLENAVELEERKSRLSALLLHYASCRKKPIDPVIREAINEIIQLQGHLKVTQLVEGMQVNLRTFQRHFRREVGLTPKQFAQIIQFQHSYSRLTEKAHSRLTDIVYDHGYADQSHFIRVFKEFTGKTP